MSRLAESGQPLFYPVDGVRGFGPPEIRLGESVRTTVRALGGMQKEALVAARRAGSVWRLASDEGAYLDGDDEAPCPLSFLTSGMIASYTEEILALARQRGIEIRELRLIQDNYYTMQGSALRGTMRGGARDVELEARIASPADRDSLTRLVHDATAASPLNGLLRRPVESEFSLRHNGRPIPCDRVRPSRAEPPPFPADEAFDALTPLPGEWHGLIRRNGMSPQTRETTGFAGSSLAEHQDRILHVRGICSLREDGVKQIEQQLFNPHGSIFRFLSDEAPANGGHGLAPDACTLISAGIAFCFMTQLGRYARIARKDLRDYRIVQDTHFSLGGASHGTAESGRADPVETHVSLDSDEDDDFARLALDMSEQTCFLHALCRSTLKTRIRLRELRD